VLLNTTPRVRVTTRINDEGGDYFAQLVGASRVSISSPNPKYSQRNTAIGTLPFLSQIVAWKARRLNFSF
jgi:hypothetical protein